MDNSRHHPEPVSLSGGEIVNMASRCSMRGTLLLCLAVLIVGCGRPTVAPGTPTPASTTAPTEPTYVVQRGKVVRTVEFDGRISPVEQVSLHFKTSGYVKQIHAKQGDRVQAGDLLAELETADLPNQIAQAEAALSSAQLALSNAERAREQELALAKLNLSVAQTKLKQAEDANAYAITQAGLSLELAREHLASAQALQATYAAEVVRARIGLEQAKDQVERAQIEYQKSVQERPWEAQQVREAYARELQQAKWNLEIAQALHDKAVAGRDAYDHDLKVQEIAVRQAQAGLEQLKKGVDPLFALEVQRAQQVLDQLAEGVDPKLASDADRAELVLEGLQGHLADARIVAPQGGEILSLSLYPGRLVEGFTTVVVIADPSAVEVRASPPSEQLKAVAEGQQATVALSLRPDSTWTGTVHLLDPYGSAGSSGSQSEAEGTVRISLEGDVSGLKLGDPVQVTIVLEDRDDVLWLPPGAVRSFQGRHFVIVQEGSRQRRVDVVLGVVGQDRVEILGGLEEGQMVVAQ